MHVVCCCQCVCVWVLSCAQTLKCTRLKEGLVTSLNNFLAYKVYAYVSTSAPMYRITCWPRLKHVLHRQPQNLLGKRF